jgi:hypothetical protein
MPDGISLFSPQQTSIFLLQMLEKCFEKTHSCQKNMVVKLLGYKGV